MLFTGVDLSQFAPVPELDVAGNILLNIWDAIEGAQVRVMGAPFVVPLLVTADLSRRITEHFYA